MSDMSEWVPVRTQACSEKPCDEVRASGLVAPGPTPSYITSSFKPTVSAPIEDRPPRADQRARRLGNTQSRKSSPAKPADIACSYSAVPSFGAVPSFTAMPSFDNPLTCCTRSSAASSGAGRRNTHSFMREEDWNRRQGITGAVARVVSYPPHVQPSEDLLGFACTATGHVVVTDVRIDGLAARAKVKRGDRLVSIDGRKDFDKTNPLSKIHDALGAPLVTLVFLGFEGPANSEVKIFHAARIEQLGLSTSIDFIASPRNPDSVASAQRDPNIFGAASFPVKSGSLLLASEDSRNWGPPMPPSVPVRLGPSGSLPWFDAMDISVEEIAEVADEVMYEAPQAQAPTSSGHSISNHPDKMYELQKRDARYILQYALAGTGGDNELSSDY